MTVGRSPLVKAKDHAERKGEKRYLHGPVAYSLSIYPPFVVVNLLPTKGRFELMHAVRRTVLWFSDLEPGQQCSVHSVGLDAPLLLLLNLGYCRTPVGEGALVHHGADSPSAIRGRSICFVLKGCRLCNCTPHFAILINRKPRGAEVNRKGKQSSDQATWQDPHFDWRKSRQTGAPETGACSQPSAACPFE